MIVSDSTISSGRVTNINHLLRLIALPQIHLKFLAPPLTLLPCFYIPIYPGGNKDSNYLSSYTSIREALNLFCSRGAQAQHAIYIQRNPEPPPGSSPLHSLQCNHILSIVWQLKLHTILQSHTISTFIFYGQPMKASMPCAFFTTYLPVLPLLGEVDLNSNVPLFINFP